MDGAPDPVELAMKDLLAAKCSATSTEEKTEKTRTDEKSDTLGSTSETEMRKIISQLLQQLVTKVGKMALVSSASGKLSGRSSMFDPTWAGKAGALVAKIDDVIKLARSATTGKGVACLSRLHGKLPTVFQKAHPVGSKLLADLALHGSIRGTDSVIAFSKIDWKCVICCTLSKSCRFDVITKHLLSIEHFAQLMSTIIAQSSGVKERDVALGVWRNFLHWCAEAT